MSGLGPRLTPLPRPRTRAGLVETGVFGLVRHPIYGGLILVALGWALVRTSVGALVLSAVLAVFFELKSHLEELWLAERFPGYEAYRRRTPRKFLPFVY